MSAISGFPARTGRCDKENKQLFFNIGDNIVMLFQPIHIDKIPASLPFYRALAEKNDPLYLEEKDFFSLSLSSQEFQLMTGVSLTKEMGGVFDRFNLYRASRYAMEWVQQLSGDKEVLEPSDVHKLATYFGENAPLIVEEMKASLVHSGKDFTFVVAESKKFEGDPKYQKLLKEANALLPKAFEEFSRRLGLEVKMPEKYSKGIIFISDRTSETLEPGEEKKKRVLGGHFFESLEIGITFGTEQMMFFGLQSLKHEIGHFWLFLANGGEGNREQYRQYPSWFREGLSVFLADETETRRYKALAFKGPNILAKRFSSNIGPLGPEGLKESKEHYAAGVTMQILMEEYGPQVIRNIIGAVRSGKTFSTALCEAIPNWKGEENFYTELQGKTLKRILEQDPQEARHLYVAALTAVFPEAARRYYQEKQTAWGEVEGILSTLDSRKDRDKLNKFKEGFEYFLSQYSDSSFSYGVHYLLGITYTRLNDYEKAALHYRKILEDPTRLAGTLAEKVLYLEVAGRAAWDEEGAQLIQNAAKLLTDPIIRSWTYGSVSKRLEGTPPGYDAARGGITCKGCGCW